VIGLNEYEVLWNIIKSASPSVDVAKNAYDGLLLLVKKWSGTIKRYKDLERFVEEHDELMVENGLLQLRVKSLLELNVWKRLFDEPRDFLMGVGKTYYPTEVHFLEEAIRMGISKRLPRNLPRGLVPGKSRIFLVHWATRRIFCVFRASIQLVVINDDKKRLVEYFLALLSLLKVCDASSIAVNTKKEVMQEEKLRYCGVKRLGAYAISVGDVHEG